MQIFVTIYLTAKTADAGLTNHAEQLRLSRVLVAQETNACFIINTYKARVRCRKRSASLCSSRRRSSSCIMRVQQDTTKLSGSNFLYSSYEVENAYKPTHKKWIQHSCNYSNQSSSYNVWWACCKLALSTPLTSHISPLCVAELLALMVRPSPSRSPSRSLSPGIVAPIWVEGDGDGGCNASVQNNVRGPWSSQKWQRATRAFICNANKKFNEHCCISCIVFSVIRVIISFCSVVTR